MRNVRYRQVQENRKKRRLVYLTFGILLVVYMTVNMIIGENGLLKYLKLRSMKDVLLAETLTLKKQNEDASNQIESMENEPERVEELAREYGLTKKGELIFKFDNEQ
jgi:cell division protein FtsB